jgi:hypothetical protein
VNRALESIDWLKYHKSQSIDIDMTEDISQRRIKITKRKEEVVKAQTPGPETAEEFRQETSNKKTKT